MAKMIIYVGMDVHKESYTLCCYNQATDRVLNAQAMASDYTMVIKYLNNVKSQMEKLDTAEISFICGYEAGCLGYSLYNQLNRAGVDCVILAPSTMATIDNKRIKTDKRDAANIAKCLAFGTYRKVYVPTAQDESVKEFIRMRNVAKQILKATKQQILALLLRHGQSYDGGAGNWTKKHIAWLRSRSMGGILQETLQEYMTTYDYMADKLERLDGRIEEVAESERYLENVGKLSCLIGVKTHTALAVLVEIGDFARFATPTHLAAYIGLVPGETSSGSKQVRLGITKAGNAHIRRLLIESAQGYTRGSVGYKSVTIKRRQKGKAPEIIAYADKANERLRRKYYRMTLQKNKKSNVAKTAVARELLCFMWGMMTGNVA
jgi:transposase